MIQSTVFYLLIFFTCTVCFFISERLNKNQQKYSKIFAAFAIILISLIAGLRGEDVGVDVKVYITNYCKIAENLTGLKSILNNNILNIGNEYAFGILLYLCTRFKHSVQIILFLIQFLTVLPIYKACTTIKHKYNNFSITFSMMVYMFLYFNNTLNNMRQSIAIGFLILGTVLGISNENKNRFIKYIPFIIAILFHKSAIIGILLLFIIKFLYFNKKKLNKFLIIVLNLIIVAIPIIIQPLYELMVRFGLSNSHFDYYADIFIFKSTEKDWFINPLSLYSLAFLVFILCFSVILICNCKSITNKEEENNKVFFANIVLYGYLIYTIILFAFKTMYGIRISIMLDMYNIIALPLCLKDKKNSMIVTSIILLICWLTLVIRLGWSGSNIYTFFN